MYVFSLLCTTEVADSMEVNTVEYVLLDMKTGSGKRHRLKEGVFSQGRNSNMPPSRDRSIYH